MTGWSSIAAWAKREQKSGDRLPYLAHVDDSMIQLRDGSLMQSIHLTGVAFETEDSEQLNHYLAARDTALRGALDGRFVLYHHIIRRQVQVHDRAGGPHAAAMPAFALALHDRWHDQLATRVLFVNDLFVTIVRRPPRGKAGWLERARRMIDRSGGGDLPDPDATRELQAATTAMLAALHPYGARLLGCYQGKGGRCSEPLELLSALFNGEMRPVLKPAHDADIGQMLPYHRISFGVDALELRGPARHGFGAMLSMKEYPSETRPGLLDQILRLPHEFVLTESFAPADRQIARERIDLALRRLRATDDEGAAERRDLMQAKDGLVTGQIGFGEHHLSLLIRAPQLAALDRAVAEASATFADIGAIVVREDVNLEPAFWGQFPGNEAYLARRALISTANIAAMVSLHGFPTGQSSGNHWGDAVTVLATTSHTPYFFNFHEGDLGNFTVIGPSGSGKTVVMNFLAAEASRLAPRLVLFDKDRGAEIFVRAMEGHYTTLQPGAPTGFNPLLLPDNAVNRAFLRDWVACLVTPAGQALTASDHAIIAAAVEANFDQSPVHRRLGAFRELLGGTRRPTDGDLASRLAPWVQGGEHGWLFDNAADRLDLETKVTGFDMTALLDHPVLRTPAMMYLFHRIDERLDGTPAVIMIDEGWKALDDPIFAARIRDWMKTLRKRNAIVGFGTQSARDALDSRVASAIVEQTATRIFMPNSRAREEDYCDGFGLTRHELDLIRALPAHAHCFLVRRANHSVVARLDLADHDDLLTVLSGRESSVRRLDRLRADHGDHPSGWYAALTGADWPGETPDRVAVAAE